MVGRKLIPKLIDICLILSNLVFCVLIRNNSFFFYSFSCSDGIALGCLCVFSVLLYRITSLPGKQDNKTNLRQ